MLKDYVGILSSIKCNPFKIGEKEWGSRDYSDIFCLEQILCDLSWYRFLLNKYDDLETVTDTEVDSVEYNSTGDSGTNSEDNYIDYSNIEDEFINYGDTEGNEDDYGNVDSEDDFVNYDDTDDSGNIDLFKDWGNDEDDDSSSIVESNEDKGNNSYNTIDGGEDEFINYNTDDSEDDEVLLQDWGNDEDEDRKSVV